MEGYIDIGYTRKPVGVKGELRLQVNERYLEDFLQATVLFLDIDGSVVPYFVEETRLGKTPMVKFEDVDSPEQAQQIGSKGLYLRESDLLAEEERVFEVVDEALEFAYLKGYTLYDRDHQVGEIEEVLEFPQQEMALINYRNQEIFIPLNNQLIQSVDQNNRQVILTLPDGLLDL